MRWLGGEEARLFIGRRAGVKFSGVDKNEVSN